MYAGSRHGTGHRSQRRPEGKKNRPTGHIVFCWWAGYKALLDTQARGGGGKARSTGSPPRSASKKGVRGKSLEQV